MFIVLFVLGALWHLFDKRIFDWIGLNWYCIISSYMFIVLFVLGALWHLFDKRIFDWIGLNWYCIETAKHIIKFFHHLVGPPFYES